MLFDDWDDFISIVKYWQLGIDFRHKISQALSLIRTQYYNNENETILFNQWLTAKVNDTRDMIEYYKVNE